ncbi:5-formyltetrahydrofolate cyclo-ligase [Anopheles sinensis]|uniref:5-formyltetrahydrofolate cyclo-ligase n=1 Tax=Anopheles sinensis TaxID=74873 RepID=A0A084WSZ7_ANOSI|nr:5-formyltetrahydrofolate cyclo-ligase [Anopheles sinensis]
MTTGHKLAKGKPVCRKASETESHNRASNSCAYLRGRVTIIVKPSMEKKWRPTRLARSLEQTKATLPRIITNVLNLY